MKAILTILMILSFSLSVSVSSSMSIVESHHSSQVLDFEESETDNCEEGVATSKSLQKSSSAKRDQFRIKLFTLPPLKESLFRPPKRSYSVALNIN